MQCPHPGIRRSESASHQRHHSRGFYPSRLHHPRCGTFRYIRSIFPAHPSSATPPSHSRSVHLPAAGSAYLPAAGSIHSSHSRLCTFLPHQALYTFPHQTVNFLHFQASATYASFSNTLPFVSKCLHVLQLLSPPLCSTPAYQGEH